MVVAETLKGRQVHPDVSVGVAPGSRQVFGMLARSGALTDLIAAGVRVQESACGFCIGNGQAPSTEAVSIRTNNRNFEGRSGTRSARVFLASPETAVACALTGKITDPRDLGMAYPEIAMPAHFWIDDSMVLEPSGEPDAVEISRGPNIGDPPVNEPLPELIQGNVAIKVGDKITTDHIMPAGPRLKYRSNVPKYAEFVFEGLDPDFSARCLENRKEGVHNIIVGGSSYGQGSSREHAALCPMYLGVKAVVAKSLERIHTANLINFGILPLTFERESDYETIEQGDEVALPGIASILREGGPMVLVNRTGNTEIPLTCHLTERQVGILLAGGLLNYTRELSR
jgi:aconitate hydratase